ncbi:MAG: hypothetical protein QOJ82_3989 [Solirubrobacteraceae bacterium]|nr:hypothetical protein [Solirubrobacteraceae bacterium]
MTPRVSSEGLTNVDVVTFALARLHGDEQAVHLERIAVEARALSPGAFRWDLDEYAEFIDKDKVRVSLTDAEKPDKGGLVEGVGARRAGQSKRTDRWRLTASGASWVLANQGRLSEGLASAAPRLKRGKANAIRDRVLRSPLYAEFKATSAVPADPYAFTDLLECSPDAANSVVRQRFDELEAQLRLLGDAELLGFLAACGDANTDMLEPR